MDNITTITTTISTITTNIINDIMNLLDKINVSIKYVIEHYEKFILLLSVFVIVYIIDYISNINSLTYGISQIPNITNNLSIVKPQSKSKNKQKK